MKQTAKQKEVTKVRFSSLYGIFGRESVSGDTWHQLAGKHVTLHIRTTVTDDTVTRAEIIASTGSLSYKFKFFITFVDLEGNLKCLAVRGRLPTRDGMDVARARVVALVNDRIELLRKGVVDEALSKTTAKERLLAVRA